MPVADMIRREIVARGSFAYTPANFARALELLGQGAIRLDPWIAEAPLAAGGDWFERLIEAPGDVSKVLLAQGIDPHPPAPSPIKREREKCINWCEVAGDLIRSPLRIPVW